MEDGSSIKLSGDEDKDGSRDEPKPELKPKFA
jgi:hypothetical protein